LSPRRQTLLGLGFAAAAILAWMGFFLWGVFAHRWSSWDLVRVPAFLVVQTWLSAALFIIAHDAIHGSLAPGRPRLNALVGQICVGLYAAFSFRKLATSHHRHHEAPGGDDDPDFHPAAPSAFLPWFRSFIGRYFGLAEFLRLTVGVSACLLLGARMSNILVFWAAPAVLSAVQLFYFGTYLPHRHEAAPFADRHRARSLRQPYWMSLATCLHFGGFHHEHHLHPGLPWWRLPEGRAQSLDQS
jgi:beta-carotene ketolase (CrtW type)